MKTLGQILGTTNRDVYEDDIAGLKPGESRDFTIDDHSLRVTATSEFGCDTGRRRYRVECLSCKEVIHKATTGAYWNMDFHLREEAYLRRGSRLMGATGAKVHADVDCSCYGCEIERRRAGIRSVDRTADSCNPPDACKTHGRCWRHSEWIDAHTCDPINACAEGITCCTHARRAT